MAFELLAHLHRRQMGRDGGARGEAARIGARRDRPLIFRGVEFQHHFDVVRRQPKLVGDDLRQHGLMALALDGDIGGDGDGAERIDVDARHRDGAVFRAGFVARLRRHQGRQVSHIRHRRLDDGGKADAVKPALGARLLAPALEVGQPSLAGR